MAISTATIQDIPQLVALINSAYRGEASRKGWTTEADLLEGELRTDIATLSGLMNKDGATLLKYTSPEGMITGLSLLTIALEHLPGNSNLLSWRKRSDLMMAETNMAQPADIYPFHNCNLSFTARSFGKQLQEKAYSRYSFILQPGAPLQCYLSISLRITYPW